MRIPSLYLSFYFILIPVLVSAQIPKLISYQGILTNSEGEPLPDGDHSLLFTLYDAPSGGNLVWQESQVITLSKGLFNTNIGMETNLDIPFDRPYWLGISVDGGAELDPRTTLTASPYSLGSLGVLPEPGMDFMIRNDSGDVVHYFDSGGDTQHRGIGNFGKGVTINTQGDSAIYLIPTPEFIYLGPDSSGSLSRSVLDNTKTVISKVPIHVKVDESAIIGSSKNGKGIIGLSVDKTGVHGISDNLFGVLGESKNDIGVFGKSDGGDGVFGSSISGIGVKGSSDQKAGVEGFSEDGDGVKGESLNRYGVYGKSGNIGAGVFGESIGGDGVVGASKTGIGVNGESSSGSGIYGKSKDGFGVQGESESQSGVYGKSDSDSGVYGESSDGDGVHGKSEIGFGVLGESPQGAGVYGESKSGWGVYGESTENYGIFGLSEKEAGVIGQSDKNYGVVGESTELAGVFGSSQSFSGVYGQTENSESAGVEGDNMNGPGVLGTSEAEDAGGVQGENTKGAGVFGRSKSLTAGGVEGFNDEGPGVIGESTKGIGIIGKGLEAAGKFEGDVLIEKMGKLKIDNVPENQGLTKFLVWDEGDNKLVKWRTLSTGNGGIDEKLDYDLCIQKGKKIKWFNEQDETIGSLSSDGNTGLQISTVRWVAINDFTGSPVFSTDVQNMETYINGVLNVGNLNVSGTKNFKIDHPLDPENKYLIHSCVESPDMKNVYDGVVQLNQSGEARINLPEWFGALNQDFRYQLTCLGEFAPVYISDEIQMNQFSIAGGKPNMKVSWQVTGIRHDKSALENQQPIEGLKSAPNQAKIDHK